MADRNLVVRLKAEITEGRWVIETEECFARKALNEHAEAEKPPPHTLRGVRLGRDDDADLTFDPTVAAQRYAEHVAQYQ